MKYWETIADNLTKAGWSWSCVTAADSQWRTIWIVDAHRGDGKRFAVHADEKLSAFLELEAAIRSGRAPRGLRGVREITLDNCRGSSKSLLDYVIRRFNLSSPRLNKPQRLDLR